MQNFPIFCRCKLCSSGYQVEYCMTASPDLNCSLTLEGREAASFPPPLKLADASSQFSLCQLRGLTGKRVRGGEGERNGYSRTTTVLQYVVGVATTRAAAAEVHIHAATTFLPLLLFSSFFFSPTPQKSSLGYKGDTHT